MDDHSYAHDKSRNNLHKCYSTIQYKNQESLYISNDPWMLISCTDKVPRIYIPTQAEEGDSVKKKKKKVSQPSANYKYSRLKINSNSANDIDINPTIIRKKCLMETANPSTAIYLHHPRQPLPDTPI